MKKTNTSLPNGEASAQIEQALLKRALGYDSDEVVEEYAVVDGEQTLIKRKVTVKNVSPDLSAIRYLRSSLPGLADMTTAQLRAEKSRLLKLLASKPESQKNKNNTE